MQPQFELIFPDWSAPASVVACCTTRLGGVSNNGYHSLNLASHVGDEPSRVLRNRDILCQSLQLPGEPQWLEQIHSTRVIHLDREQARDGDAAVTATAGKVSVVLTADCLPVLFCNRDGSEVAAAHAGWRGLVNGVLEQTVQAMQSAPADIMAWLGPAIGPQHFEVGAEVRQAFVDHTIAASNCFVENRPDHFLADLYQLARQRLNNAGIELISGGGYCTYSEDKRFYSYRREKQTGRQASLIYIKP
jgi:YfiH family protein